MPNDRSVQRASGARSWKRNEPMTALGIIAGGGELPCAIAESALEAGRAVFIVALQGSADETIARFPHEWAGIGEVGKALKLLRAHDCSDILLVGRVARPRF